MIGQKFKIKADQPVLDQLLEAWEMSYTDFARQIGVTYKALLKYRNGEIEFKLNTAQIKAIEQLLEKLELKWTDLPDDWILRASNSPSDLPVTH